MELVPLESLELAAISRVIVISLSTQPSGEVGAVRIEGLVAKKVESANEVEQLKKFIETKYAATSESAIAACVWVMPDTDELMAAPLVVWNHQTRCFESDLDVYSTLNLFTVVGGVPQLNDIIKDAYRSQLGLATQKFAQLHVAIKPSQLGNTKLY